GRNKTPAVAGGGSFLRGARAYWAAGALSSRGSDEGAGASDDSTSDITDEASEAIELITDSTEEAGAGSEEAGAGASDEVTTASLEEAGGVSTTVVALSRLKIQIR